jgi:hypothetical protein
VEPTTTTRCPERTAEGDLGCLVVRFEIAGGDFGIEMRVARGDVQRRRCQDLGRAGR